MTPTLTSKPRILFLDIETFPLVSYTWARYDQNVVGVQREGCIATFAAKWSEGKVFSRSLPDYKGYKPNSYDDRLLVAELWRLLDEADVVVAHNGDSFDVRVINARFIFHGLKPPSPFKTVDTKKVAKKVARFSSNKLDDLGKHLEGEGKIKTDFDLWLGCIEGDKAAWKRMVTYNERDVELLARVYKRLLPWMSNHPNVGIFGDTSDPMCPKCGSLHLQSRGVSRSSARSYRRYQCQGCGGWCRTLHSERAVTITHA